MNDVRVYIASKHASEYGCNEHWCDNPTNCYMRTNEDFVDFYYRETRSLARSLDHVKRFRSLICKGLAIGPVAWVARKLGRSQTGSVATLPLVAVVGFVAIACASDVDVTREVIREVEVTREVEVPRTIEVTREIERTVLVEVTREVEVTRVHKDYVYLEATRQVPVTRIVEVTSTPTPMPVDTPTPTPTDNPQARINNCEPGDDITFREHEFSAIVPDAEGNIALNNWVPPVYPVRCTVYARTTQFWLNLSEDGLREYIIPQYVTIPVGDYEVAVSSFDGVCDHENVIGNGGHIDNTYMNGFWPHTDDTGNIIRIPDRNGDLEYELVREYSKGLGVYLKIEGVRSTERVWDPKSMYAESGARAGTYWLMLKGYGTPSRIDSWPDEWQIRLKRLSAVESSLRKHESGPGVPPPADVCELFPTAN